MEEQDMKENIPPQKIDEDRLSIPYSRENLKMEEQDSKENMPPQEIDEDRLSIPDSRENLKMEKQDSKENMPPQEIDEDRLSIPDSRENLKMEKQDSKENIPPQEIDEDTIKKIKKMCLIYWQLPHYVQKMIKDRNAVKAQYMATKEHEKRVEFIAVFEAVESELRLHQYRIYRKYHPNLVECSDESSLRTHLTSYVKELVKKSIKNRLCYITTRENFYKMNYNGMKKALKTLIDAVDGRIGYEICMALDNQTITIDR